MPSGAARGVAAALLCHAAYCTAQEYEFEMDSWARWDQPSDFTDYYDLRRDPPQLARPAAMESHCSAATQWHARQGSLDGEPPRCSDTT